MAIEDKLLKDILNGNRESLDDLVVLFYPDILRYCLWHTKDRQSAEDATQETFLKAIHHLSKYSHRGKFRAYLFTIACNVCKDQWKQKQADKLLESYAFIETGFEMVEQAVNFNQLIVDLPPEQREIVLLRFAHNFKIREISEILNQPFRTVQSRLRLALKKLEKNLA